MVIQIKNIKFQPLRIISNPKAYNNIVLLIAAILGELYMESFEWEVFKRTGNVSHYLMMKEREQDKQNYLEEYALEEEFDIEE